MATDETLNDWQRRCYALVDEKYALERELERLREENAKDRAAWGRSEHAFRMAEALLMRVLDQARREGTLEMPLYVEIDKFLYPIQEFEEASDGE